MQNNNFERKHFRGSSPHEEIEEGFANWVRGLQSVEQTPEDSLTAQFVELGKNQRTGCIAQESGPRQQSEDEARWDDDGGESG